MPVPIMIANAPMGGSRRCSRDGLITGCQARKHGANSRTGPDPQGANGCSLPDAASSYGEGRGKRKKIVET